jgi:hypothetical protein
MASALSPTQKTLNLRRDVERSRLETQLLATAYELLTPILRRALPSPQPKHQPTQQPRKAHERRQRQAGGQ